MGPSRAGPSKADMDAFMAHLLADVDASVFDLPPSQSPPKKPCSLEAAQSSQQRIRSMSPARRSPAAHKRPKLGHASAELRMRTRVKDEPGDDAGSSSCLRTSPSAPTPSTKQIAAESDEQYDGKSAARSRKDAIRVAREQAEERGVGSSDQMLASSFAHKSSAAEYREKRQREREAARSYVRAKVLNIGQDNFIPASALSAPASAPPALISASTVDKMRTRRQVVLNVEERAPLDIRDKNFVRADEHGARRKIYLRDEWLSLAERIRVGDYVHLIGHWSEAFDDLEDALSVTGPPSSSASAQAGQSSQVNGHPVSKPDLAIAEVDEDDDDDMSLWANLDCTLPSSTPTKLPLMILSSSGALDASGHPPCKNLLILHPDLLLSATSISNVSTCLRRPLISSRLRASAADGATSEALVMGAMLHVVLQSCLTGTALPSTCEGSPSPSGIRTLPSLEMPECFPPTWNGVPPTNFSASFVAEQICAQVDACLEDLADAGLDTQVAREHLIDAVKPFGEFAFKYLASPEGDIPHDAVAIDSRSESPPRVRIRRVLEVEEDIWSPMYGLKGFVDISVEPAVRFVHSGGVQTFVMPLELKTGRAFANLEHRAQTMMYMLMMSERYGTDCQQGLLYYSRSGDLHRVRKSANEIRALIIGRNELASYMLKRSAERRSKVLAKPESQLPEAPPRLELPATIDSERTCGRCYAVDGCMLYRRAVDDVTEDPENPSPIADLYDKMTAHLTDEHAAFFAHWERLLTLEEEDISRFRRELWTMTAAAREQRGAALADMQLVPEEASRTAVASQKHRRDARHRHTYEFKRRAKSALEAVFHCPLALGERVVLSVSSSLPALASGMLIEISNSSVVLALERDLGPVIARLDDEYNTGDYQFRIDRDELGGSMARVRHNIARLFFAGEAGDEKRRELVVDLKTPRFLPPCDQAMSLPDHLNEDQHAAMRHVLKAQDYALLVGMPGTGKTTTISELIRLLVSRGKTVLLASYTHSAVDTICKKLIRSNSVDEEATSSVDLLRLGDKSRIDSAIHPYVLADSANVEDFEAKLLKPNVVATTCLSQLPPLVRNMDARHGGLDVSLFNRLAEAHPTSQVYLTRQYRMNGDIMTLSNQLVYHGRLQCGSAEVENLSLALPKASDALARLRSPNNMTAGVSETWLQRVIQPDCKVVFLNTDHLPAPESRVGELVQNEVEAELVCQICAALILGGCEAGDIGVITPLRQQIRLLTNALGINATSSTPTDTEKSRKGIEILTADRAQGRDKSVVLVSFVRNNTIGEGGKGSVGELLNDVRRINVSLTRAQRKLVMVGSRKTLQEVPLLHKLLELVDGKGWCIDLERDDHRRFCAPQGLWTSLANAASSQSQYLFDCTPSATEKQNPGRAGASFGPAAESTLKNAPAHHAGSGALVRKRPLLRDIINEQKGPTGRL
ncbi:hypothetical protein IE81DRAFT_314288 [Ceraceosorus guamensis]|uniref:DNA replication ATP-dependent helicase/nuclease n=1 Tax=Ceraceosorus guamensis TaxID=1522189 RepID=A0A316W0M4_9BASI|nr:hypothetical protein IE81DRAFT_314288 [Ceraceosorus guamensis]PWN42091.1 hypothetical protein IE81DRAFT_314288 [Ceraceosorus guamensis]